MASPTIYAIESYCPLLTLPTCLYGMNDVAKALAKLHAFCSHKVLATLNSEQFKLVLLLISKDILEPVVDLLWCRFVKNPGSVDQMPADFSQGLKELEAHLSAPMIDNIWKLHLAGDDANAPHQAESLLTALQRLRDFFQDVIKALSSDGTMQAAMALEPIQLPNTNDPIKSSPEPKKIESKKLKPHVSESINSNIYSLFGGCDAWPFDSVQVDAIVDDSGQNCPSSINPSSPHLTLQTSSSFPTLARLELLSQQDYPHCVDQLSPTSSSGETHAAPQKQNTACAICSEANNGSKNVGDTGVNLFCSLNHPFSKPNEEDLASLITSLTLSTFNGMDRQAWQESPIRYKTAMCKRVIDGQKCRYSKACGFAHSETERELYTRLHLATTRCTFGPKCHNPTCGRAHTAQEQHLAIKVYTRAVLRGRGAPLKL